MNDCGVVRPMVLVLEGVNDCEFLCRLSRRLHAENPQLADLTGLHADGRILLVPTGGATSTSGWCALQPWVAKNFTCYVVHNITLVRSGDRSRNTACAKRPSNS